MLAKQADGLEAFVATDGCLLAEVIHPANDSTSPGISLSRASLAPGKATSPHRLEFVEIYYVLRGGGRMHLDGEVRELIPDSCVYVPPGAVQWVENPGPEELLFLCVCHPAWSAGGDHPA
ncbi:MAG: cupin domain-containing protein [Desulfarculaceae bacterium]|nr:cupin domain-containing protein [Desulfarculaceae bacterium]MCF8073492.1 cupin domain-containing protein [Desulfarculaceae bacterium]MCF8100361.1 cupin domain-containing protein [Desulfarculaceae bacterium]MCF8118229.1 cupin domain-containing protein [Desulfarculaceae bacterium]